MSSLLARDRKSWTNWLHVVVALSHQQSAQSRLRQSSEMIVSTQQGSHLVNFPTPWQSQLIHLRGFSMVRRSCQLVNFVQPRQPRTLPRCGSVDVMHAQRKKSKKVFVDRACVSRNFSLTVCKVEPQNEIVACFRQARHTTEDLDQAAEHADCISGWR